MIDLVNEYLDRGTSFTELVGRLEGAVQAGEFDEDLERQFYDYWTPLEVARALINDHEITLAQAENDVRSDMVRLRDYLHNVAAGRSDQG